MSLSLVNQVSASQTEIEVTGGIENVTSGGIIQIESEIISFTCASNTGFLTCVRGIGGTSAVVHARGKLVTLLGLTPVTVSTIDAFYVSQSYGANHSFQSIAADLTLGTNAGSADGSNPKYNAAAMFNLFGADMVSDADYLAGVIGAYSITGTKATTYPAGAVLGQITDGVTDADGAFVAYIDGDSSLTKARAAFTVMNNNSTGGSGFHWGLDLKGATHDGFPAVSFLDGEMRFSNGTYVTVSGDTIVFHNAANSKTSTITMS